MATSDQVKEVLRHLLQKLQDPESRHYQRYSSWIEKHPDLEDFIYGKLKPSFIKLLEGNDRSTFRVREMHGDLHFEGRAIYLHCIAGLDRRHRLYVGQSNQLSNRLWRQHNYFRYRRDNPSLHYHALQNSTFDVYAICATLPADIDGGAPGMDQPQLVMNILEMYCALLLRTLPRKLLLEYLPTGAKVPIGPPDGLNVACPLDQGLQFFEFEPIDLSESQDPLVLEYVGQKRQKPVEEPTQLPKKRIEEPWVSPQVLFFGAAAVAGILLLRNQTVRRALRAALA